MTASEVRRRRAERAERDERLATQASFAVRRGVLVAFLGVFLVAAVGSAFYRQVIVTDFLQEEGNRRFLRDREIPARRGLILDRNGEPLAVSTPVATVWADPGKLLARPELVTELAQGLGVQRSAVEKRLKEKQDKAFIYLKRRIGPEQTVAMEELISRHRPQEIGLETEYRRFYPSGEVFGHLVGFTNIDDRGIEGMELAFESWLAAQPGLRRVIQDGRGRMVDEVDRMRPPQDGRDLTLSLDRRLQFLAFRELKRAMQENQAEGATAVILDVTTGEVLAMVNQPAYNPNGPMDGAGSTRRNRALTDVFEPGSTIKPLVMAAALEAGKVKPGTPIDTSPGTYQIGRNTVKDVHNYGLLDATGVITKSSNIGVVKLALGMDRAVLWQLYDRAGFGRSTACGFPGEVSGRLPHFGGWSMFEHATLAFGYGLNTNVLQLAQAYAMLAADGVKRPVTLLRREGPAPEGERVLSAKTARTVRAMMETVVSEKGTAREAAVEGYRVAGKTGTAKKAVAGGYAAKRYQAIFAGMAPVTNPRFVMVVMVDEPNGNFYYGGKVAAPVFARVMRGALRLYNVPPDDPTGKLLLAGTEASR